jgi:hypothetical protein
MKIANCLQLDKNSKVLERSLQVISEIAHTISDIVVPWLLFSFPVLMTYPCIPFPESWFEFTPHHAGYPALKSYIPITQFGSQFENGRLVKSALERDLSFLRGQCGSYRIQWG